MIPDFNLPCVGGPLHGDHQILKGGTLVVIYKHQYKYELDIPTRRLIYKGTL